MVESVFPKISEPAARAMEGAGIKDWDDLVKWTEKDLLKLHGFGPNALRILKETMKEKGLKFAEGK